MSTIAILWPVKAIFEKRAATVEVDSFLSPAVEVAQGMSQAYVITRKEKSEPKKMNRELQHRLLWALPLGWGSRVFEC